MRRKKRPTKIVINSEVRNKTYKIKEKNHCIKTKSAITITRSD